MAAGQGRGKDDFRASRGDREQVVELLKAAFVEDRLTMEELDARVGQAFASRTYAELAAVTADIPAGSAAARPSPRQPARGQNRAARNRTGRDVAIGSGIGLSIVVAIVFGGLLNAVAFGIFAVPFAVLLPIVVICSAGRPDPGGTRGAR